MNACHPFTNTQKTRNPICNNSGTIFEAIDQHNNLQILGAQQALPYSMPPIYIWVQYGLLDLILQREKYRKETIFGMMVMWSLILWWDETNELEGRLTWEWWPWMTIVINNQGDHLFP